MNAKKLLNVLLKAKKLFGTKSLVYFTNGKMKLGDKDLVYIYTNSIFNFTGVVELSKLIAGARKGKTGELAFERYEGEVWISTENGRLVIPNIESEFQYKIGSGYTLSSSVPDIVLLKNCANCCPQKKDELRENLDYVYLTETHFCGTDAHKMCYPKSEYNEYSRDCAVRADIINHFDGLNASALQIFENDNNTLVSFDDEIFVYKKWENILNFQTLIPTDPYEAVFVVDATKVTLVCGELKKTSEQAHIILDSEGLLIKSNTTFKGVDMIHKAQIKVKRIVLEDIRCLFGVNVLFDIFSLFTGEVEVAIKKFSRGYIIIIINDMCMAMSMI